MNKLLLILLLTFGCLIAHSQYDFFVFKTKNKTIASFYKDSYIAFQAESGQWFTGYIKRIHNDSFYIEPMVVRYGLMGSDTFRYSLLPFTLADVFAMPKKGIQVDYINGRFQITRSGGHVHWYWIKSGWVFRTGGAGYAALHLLNGAIYNDFSFSGRSLGIAGGVYLFGKLLQRLYKPVLPLGKKYHLQAVSISKEAEGKARR